MRKKKELVRFAKYCFGVLRLPPIAIRYCPSKALVDPAGNFCFGCYIYDDNKELSSKKVWLAYKHPKWSVMMNLAHEIWHYKQDVEGYINTMPLEYVENEAEKKSEELLAGWLIRGGGITMDIRPIDANALDQHKKTLVEHMDGYDIAYNAVPMYKVDDLPTLSLNTLRDAIYEDAVAHGLWEEADAAKDVLQLHDCCVDIIAAEVCEMGEAWDNKDAFEEELADTIIASFSAAGKLGIDIDAAIRRKMEINKKRPWKHEGEKK